MGVSAALGSSALLPAGLGFRNTLTNGSFQVDQRNSSASQTITSGAVLAYTADRWYAYCTGANVTGQRIAGSAPYQYNYQFTGATSNTLVGFGQRIEAANSFNYAGNTATLSASIKSSSLTSITWTLYYATTTDTFGTIASPTRTQIATGTFTISATLANHTAQIVVPAAATTGLELVFTTGALIASQTLVFAGIQLEQNTKATPFEQRPIGAELQLCQRYYQQFDGTGTYSRFGAGTAEASTIANILVPFFVPMRTSVPANMTLSYSAIGTTGNRLYLSDGTATVNLTSLTIGTIGSSRQLGLSAIVASGLTVFRNYYLEETSSGNEYLAVSAEL